MVFSKTYLLVYEPRRRYIFYVDLITSTNKILPNPVSTSCKAGKLPGSSTFKNNLSFNAMFGVFGAVSKNHFNRLSNTEVTYLLLGMRYYPEILSSGETGKFYFGTSIGGFVGNATIDGRILHSSPSGTIPLPMFINPDQQEIRYGTQISTGFDFLLSSSK